MWVVPALDHQLIAARIVHAAWPTLLICRANSSPADIAHQLGHFQTPAAAAGRGQTPDRRQRALRDFRTGRARALVASESCSVQYVLHGVRSIVHLGPPSGGATTYGALARATERHVTPPVFVTLVVPGQTSEMLKLMAELNLDAAFGSPAPDDL